VHVRVDGHDHFSHVLSRFPKITPYDSMSGGLFGTPFALNPKCLVFSLLIIAVYYLPHSKDWTQQIILLFLLAMSSYIALAWYDFIYQCRDTLKPTFLGFLSAPFKPPTYRQEFEQMPEATQKTIRTVDMVVLAFVVTPFLYSYFFIKKN
jgi:hypothetical protein